MRTSSPFSANLPLHSSAHVCRQYSSVSGLPQSVVGTALKTYSPFWSRIRLPSSSSSYTRRCFSPHLPFCSMGRMGQSTWKCGFDMPPSSLSGWCTAKSTTMPRLTKFSNKNCLARAMFSSRENSFCKAMSKLYASWAFFPRSAFSTAFHRVWRSAYSGGAWDGRRISEQITPPLRV